ncbi:hypothetical protein HAX54_036460, partial [Datura stramonium]|nr:hypothetical protein [Datura stramonium]
RLACPVALPLAFCRLLGHLSSLLRIRPSTFLIAQNISLVHHAPPIYTYVTVPPTTQIQGICRLDIDDYVETENEARTVNNEMVELPPGYKLPKFEKFDE